MTRVVIAVFLATAQAQSLIPFDAEVIREINWLRSNPRAYTVKLVRLRARYSGNSIPLNDRISLLTEEGVGAVDEAIEALEQTNPNSIELKPVKGLSRAAADHAADTGSHGTVGHAGTDRSDPSERVSRYGVWSGTIAENIAFGPTTAEEVVTQMLVDDGVADRGHRRSLLDPKWRLIGAACGFHTRFRTVCVLDLATSYRNK